VSSTGPKETNGPDECFQSVGSTGCPPVSYSRNREGTVGFRLLTDALGRVNQISRSIFNRRLAVLISTASGCWRPTTTIGSAGDLIALQETIEHFRMGTDRRIPAGRAGQG